VQHGVGHRPSENPTRISSQHFSGKAGSRPYTTQRGGAYTETKSRKVGILATEAVVRSGSYIKEIEKLDSSIQVFQQACPLLVPIIEAGEQNWEGTEMIVARYLGELFTREKEIDSLLLACTHYPILSDIFRRHAPKTSVILEQGQIVAVKLKDYLIRHPEIDAKISRNGSRSFLTTDTSDKFDRLTKIFYGEPVQSHLVPLESLGI
jgi:glutamate racemase